jgi:hypothetical protein
MSIGGQITTTRKDPTNDEFSVPAEQINDSSRSTELQLQLG